MAGGSNSCKVGEAQFLLAIVAKMGGSLTGKQWEEVGEECDMRKGHTAYCKFLKMKKDYTEKDPNASAGSTENVTPKKSGSKVVATGKKRKSTEQAACDDDDEVAKKVKPEPKEETADIFDEFN